MSEKAKILHLYHDLMNLYGDWGNPEILARELAARGIDAAIDRKSVGDSPDFGVYDFVYIGSGSERSQRACMRDLARRAEALAESIENGLFVLATGNSHELFGEAITPADGERYKAMGLLSFETVQSCSRVTGDCILRVISLPMAAPKLSGTARRLPADLPDRLVGFVNRAGHGQEGAIKRPFVVEMGPGSRDRDAKKDSNTEGVANDAENGPFRAEGIESNTEGIVYKNLLGTYLTGPLLIRNPALLRFVADRLFPGSERKSAKDPLFDYQEKAYAMALKELTARQPAATKI